jgi:hypothetical protein
MQPRDLFEVGVRFLGLAMLAGGVAFVLTPFIGILGVPLVGLLLLLTGSGLANAFYTTSLQGRHGSVVEDA